MSAIPVGFMKIATESRDCSRRTRTATKPTILIVEDHDDTREMLQTLFTMWGCRVVEACNGLEAVAAASRERPALILMDGSLPLLDGLSATRRIRENRLLDETTIIALNGWGSESYNVAALAAGSNNCLIKPLDFEQLQNCVVDLLGESVPHARTEKEVPRPLTVWLEEVAKDIS